MKTLQTSLELKNKNTLIDFAVAEAATNASFELPEEMIKEEKNRLMDNVTQQAKQYNLDLDTYLQYTGIPKDEFEKNLMKDAEKSLGFNLVIEEIAKIEDIQATDEERDVKYAEIAAQYKMDVTQVKAAVNVEAVNQEVVYRKTIDFLVENLDITK